MKDYSGTYKINLVPSCTVREGTEYREPLRCNPQDPVPFELPIHFQQVSDPVPTQFSLDTQFHITRRRDVWLSQDSTNSTEDVDVSFVKGTIFGLGERDLLVEHETAARRKKMSPLRLSELANLLRMSPCHNDGVCLHKVFFFFLSHECFIVDQRTKRSHRAMRETWTSARTRGRVLLVQNMKLVTASIHQS